jgi:hypothetical protein
MSLAEITSTASYLPKTLLAIWTPGIFLDAIIW